MEFKEIEAKWRGMSEEVIEGMRVWREEHPQASLKEIESTLDERLAGLRGN